MKQFTRFSFFLLSLLSFVAVVAKPISVKVKNGKFSINSVNVSQTWKSASLLNSLGPTYKVFIGANKVYTYSDLGIVVFESKDKEEGSGYISEIQFYLQLPEANSVTPTSPYTGNITIEKLAVINVLSWEQVKDKLKKYRHTQSVLSNNYRLAYKGLYMYFQFNETETQLIKLSIGKDERTYE